MIVVLDTNIFIYDSHLLRRELGQKLLRFLRAQRGQLFFPEILRAEYMQNARKLAQDYQGTVATSARNLRTLVGREIRHDTFSEEAVEQATSDRLREFEGIALPGPTIAALHGPTGDRVMAGRPPTTTAAHAYKDCMIWESVLTLAAGSDVRFVSRDSGFWDRNVFSAALLREAQAVNIEVRGYQKLDQLVQELQADSQALDMADETITDSAQSSVEIESVLMRPAREPALPGEAIAGQERQVLDEALNRVRASFHGTDGKVLGFIAFLDTAPKAQLFDLLSKTGIPIEIATNTAERLALERVVRNIGNHYVVEDQNLARAAATAVELEVIELLNRPDGNG